jgi:hypothetical protein
MVMSDWSMAIGLLYIWDYRDTRFGYFLMLTRQRAKGLGM